LYTLSHDLTGAYSIETVVQTILDTIGSTIKHDLWLLLADTNEAYLDQQRFTVKGTPGAANKYVDQAIRFTCATGELSGPGTGYTAKVSVENLLRRG